MSVKSGVESGTELIVASKIAPTFAPTFAANVAPNVASMTNAALTTSLARVSKLEREVIADVVEHIHEFMRRQLFLEQGCTSMFSYLTEKLNYAKSTAQNRIDAARLLEASPEFAQDLASGELNLSHVTILAQALRQHERERPELEILADDKRRLLERLKNRDAHESAVIVAKSLDLNLKIADRVRPQKDESIRLEITLSKGEMETLKRVKDLSSHSNHCASWAEVISMLASDFVRRKDLTVEKSVRKRPTIGQLRTIEAAPVRRELGKRDAGPEKSNSYEVKDAAHGSDPNLPGTLGSPPKPSRVRSLRKAIPTATKRFVFRRDRVCQWVHLETGEICGETFQLQIDHVRSVHQGGGVEPENLQVLCGVHNRLKYRLGN